MYTEEVMADFSSTLRTVELGISYLLPLRHKQWNRLLYFLPEKRRRRKKEKENTGDEEVKKEETK